MSCFLKALAGLILGIVNAVTLVGGINLIRDGIELHKYSGQFDGVVDVLGLMPLGETVHKALYYIKVSPAAIIVSGAILSISSFFGLCGSCTASRFLLTLHATTTAFLVLFLTYAVLLEACSNKFCELILSLIELTHSMENIVYLIIAEVFSFFSALYLLYEKTKKIRRIENFALLSAANVQQLP